MRVAGRGLTKRLCVRKKKYIFSSINHREGASTEDSVKRKGSKSLHYNKKK